MNDSNAVLQMNSFEFIKKFPATQQQLIDAGVFKNLNAVLKSSMAQSANIITAALEFLITFEGSVLQVFYHFSYSPLLLSYLLQANYRRRTTWLHTWYYVTKARVDNCTVQQDS